MLAQFAPSFTRRQIQDSAAYSAASTRETTRSRFGLIPTASTNFDGWKGSCIQSVFNYSVGTLRGLLLNTQNIILSRVSNFLFSPIEPQYAQKTRSKGRLSFSFWLASHFWDWVKFLNKIGNNLLRTRLIFKCIRNWSLNMIVGCGNLIFHLSW